MPRSTATTPITLAPLAPLRRLWVDALPGHSPTTSRTDTPEGSVEMLDALHARVRDAYLSVAATLNAQQRHPARFWNFVPHNHTPSGEELASASGVGVLGDALAIHCLAADDAGEPVENPRQVPAYTYSRRYGPRPPCFARATRLSRAIDGAWWLLVAGPASIRGELTVHAGDVAARTVETPDNLDALLAATEVKRGYGDAQARVTSLRVYIVCRDDLAVVRDRIEQRNGEVRTSSSRRPSCAAPICSSRSRASRSCRAVPENAR